jgi:transcriptional antiterminator RfaH
MMLEWYVARTQPQREKIAQVNLANQNIVTFLPLVRLSVKRFKRFEETKRPLFPGYIFFQSSRDPALWRSVGSTVGVLQVVCGGGRAHPVPKEVMDDLFLACKNDIFVGGPPGLAVNDAVTVNCGPFSSMIAKVQSLGPRGRVNLLLSAMGGLILRLDTPDIERI